MCSLFKSSQCIFIVSINRFVRVVNMFVCISVLVFPALVKIPEFNAEDRKLSFPNELNHSYCLRIEVRIESQRTWTVMEPCVTAESGVIALERADITAVNVSICLVYRPEVCGEPVASKISEYSYLYLSLFNHI